MYRWRMDLRRLMAMETIKQSNLSHRAKHRMEYKSDTFDVAAILSEKPVVADRCADGLGSPAHRSLRTRGS